jgi:hypothetical protein
MTVWNSSRDPAYLLQLEGPLITVLWITYHLGSSSLKDAREASVRPFFKYPVLAKKVSPKGEEHPDGPLRGLSELGPKSIGRFFAE